MTSSSNVVRSEPGRSTSESMSPGTPVAASTLDTPSCCSLTMCNVTVLSDYSGTGAFGSAGCRRSGLRPPNRRPGAAPRPRSAARRRNAGHGCAAGGSWRTPPRTSRSRAAARACPRTASRRRCAPSVRGRGRSPSPTADTAAHSRGTARSLAARMTCRFATSCRCFTTRTLRMWRSRFRRYHARWYSALQPRHHGWRPVPSLPLRAKRSAARRRSQREQVRSVSMWSPCHEGVTGGARSSPAGRRGRRERIS